MLRRWTFYFFDAIVSGIAVVVDVRLNSMTIVAFAFAFAFVATLVAFAGAFIIASTRKIR